MNWWRQNKFLGGFLALFAIAAILALWFLLHEKGSADDQQTRLDSTVAELNRLRSSRPFPNGENLRKTRALTDRYRDSLGELEAELKARTLPVRPLQPNEFQAQLRQAVNAVVEKAGASKVQLPPNFYLGFDEYSTSLPDSAAAPLLGQELSAIELLVTRIVDAHVDAITTFARAPLPEEKPAPSATPSPPRRGARRKPAPEKPPVTIAAHAVEISFTASPAAARKALNQIATAKEQLFIIRTLNVKNPADKGPKRGGVPQAAPSPVAPAANPANTGSTVSFIVGTEHINVTARIDIVNLAPPAKEVR
ncbi:MAG TPA: Amuc_1100 family pilus-like protein [Chthoniobacterales bacterium]